MKKAPRLRCFSWCFVLAKNSILVVVLYAFQEILFSVFQIPHPILQQFFRHIVFPAILYLRHRFLCNDTFHYHPLYFTFPTSNRNNSFAFFFLTEKYSAMISVKSQFAGEKCFLFVLYFIHFFYSLLFFLNVILKPLLVPFDFRRQFLSMFFCISLVCVILDHKQFLICHINRPFHLLFCM